MAPFFNHIKTFLKDHFDVLFTIAFSVLVIFFFFGHLVLHANSTYTEPGGDGLQSYFNCVYHATYDQDFFRQNNMNYPFGEQVFFTACQPVLTGIIKLFGMEHYTVGIMNLAMFISVILCSLFIYLIFTEFELKGISFALVACGISFLSPQIIRMIYHHTLTFQFAIPCFFWLLIKYDRTKKIKYSIYISLLTILMSSIHLYFFSFFLFIACFYYLYYLLHEDQKIIKKIIALVSMFITQIILPFLLIQIIIKLTDSVTDRTTNPWGFLVYKSNWDGVFYPYGKFEESFMHRFLSPPATQAVPEGIAYIGLFGILACLVLTLNFVFNLLRLRFKRIIPFTERPIGNYMVLTGIVALFLSFGYPFVLGHEDWLEKFGVIKQIRSIGRFAWLFFYIINIFGFVFILSLVKSQQMKKVIALLAFVIISFDSFQNINNFESVLSNKFPDLDDKKNTTENYRWLHKVNIKDYQCILPLPYFHSGSENLFLPTKGDIKKWSFIASLKTGLPILPSSFSRTSLKQTAENIQMALEQTDKSPLLNYFPNRKPILILADNYAILSEAERNILARSVLIYSGTPFNVYSIEYGTLYYLSSSVFNDIKYSFSQLNSQGKLSLHGNFYSTSSVKDFVVKSFEDTGIGPGYYSNNCTFGLGTAYSICFDDTLPYGQADMEYAVSIWINNVDKDLVPRNTFIIDLYDSLGVYYKSAAYASIKDFIKCFHKGWGMIECKFSLKSKKDRVKIGFFNDCVKQDTKIYYDELMIRPSNTILYKPLSDTTFFKNNIVYKFSPY